MAEEDKIRAPVECVIKVEGEEITELYPYLDDCKVEMSREGATTCELTLDTIRTETGEWNVQDAGIFLPWKPIVIEAHFGDRVEEVMRGYIKEVSVECPQEMSGAKVTVKGQDESLAMDRETIRRTWSTEEEQKTDGEIVDQVASDFGLTAVKETGLTNGSLSSDGTVIKFLRDRAEANGYEIYVREGELHFHPPELDGDPQATIMVYAGRATNCLSCNVKFDGHKPDQVRLNRQADDATDAEEEDFDPDLSEMGSEPADSSSSGLDPFVWSMERPNGATSEEVRARAQAKANENAWKLVAEGELDGALYGHVLLTHLTVNVDGLGVTYAGLYYVDEVTHKFSLEGYRQTFKLIRNAIGDEQSSSGGDVLSAVR